MPAYRNVAPRFTAAQREWTCPRSTRDFLGQSRAHFHGDLAGQKHLAQTGAHSGKLVLLEGTSWAEIFPGILWRSLN